jgi:pimeloyl-ACP methyl ester carboxylesterase
MRGRFADRLEDSIKRLGKTAVPTLVIWGENDRAISSKTGRRMHALLPGSEFALLESAGHVPNLEQPDAFNRAVLAFLSRT